MYVGVLPTYKLYCPGALSNTNSDWPVEESGGYLAQPARLVWKIKYRGLTDVSSAGASQWMPLGVAEGMDGDGEGSEGDERCGFVVT